MIINKFIIIFDVALKKNASLLFKQKTTFINFNICEVNDCHKTIAPQMSRC